LIFDQRLNSCGELLDARGLWWAGRERVQEAINAGGCALYRDLHVAGRVFDPACQPMSDRRVVHEWPKADALYGPGYLDVQSDAVDVICAERPARMTRILAAF